MRQMAETWAVVLAAGESPRVQTLERASCLWQKAITRARSVALSSHICTVVASQHRRWWTAAVAELNESNVFLQPQNKGTALEILLALLTLEMRNPSAKAVLLPADHYFRDESTLSRILRVAGNMACTNGGATYLMGVEPTSADTERGYILPTERVLEKPARIMGFKEKPNQEHAAELVALGALWNLFILVGSVSALLQLFAEDHWDLVEEMRQALTRRKSGQGNAVSQFYETVEPVDFARDVLEVQANKLQVLRVPHCGWNDLGTLAVLGSSDPQNRSGCGPGGRARVSS